MGRLPSHRVLRLRQVRHAAVILLRFAGGWPSLFTNRICLSGSTAGETPPDWIELMARRRRQKGAFDICDLREWERGQLGSIDGVAHAQHGISLAR